MSNPSLPGNLRGLILGILTIGLLGLYAWLVFAMIHDALAAGHEPTERVSYLITTLQSLVSALVIAVLAISPPKGPVRLSFIGVGDDGDPGAQWIAVLYVLVWFATGATALVVGYIVLDDGTATKFKTLVDLGSAWFGLAVAAAYAYLGIKP